MFGHQLESLKEEVTRRIKALYFTASAHEGALYIDIKTLCPRAMEESSLDVIEISSLKEIPSFLPQKPKLLGLELDVVPVELFFELKRIFPQVEFKNVSPLILKLRMVKSQCEIKLIKEAAQIASFGLEKVPIF